MESNIPQEIEDKMNEAVKAICEQSTGAWVDIATEGLETGYSLALPEISALKAEVERLKDALRKIEGHTHSSLQIIRIAREALRQQPERRICTDCGTSFISHGRCPECNPMG